MAKDVVGGPQEPRMRYCHSCEDLSPQCSSTDRKRRWSYPATGHLDLSSLTGSINKSAGSIALPAKSEADVAKMDLSFMDQYRSFMEEYRPFRSFVVYISLAQIAVFFYHVILASNHGFTTSWSEGPLYVKVRGTYNLIRCFTIRI